METSAVSWSGSTAFPFLKNGSDEIINRAIDGIKNGGIELSRITKSVLVVDEAQDMNADEYELVETLMDLNEDMRVILVGDDDQNIYGFRGSDSRYMQRLISDKDAVKYELNENYRSKNNIVVFANQWAERIKNRMKVIPCFARQQKDGDIKIVEYRGVNMAVPLSDIFNDLHLAGSSCLLTKTNEEAAQLAGILVQKGLQAKLIQSNDGFLLSNLYELRYFSDLLNNDDDSAIIGDDEWKNAVIQLSYHSQKSIKLSLVLSIIRQFEAINPLIKYRSDWKIFLNESKMEDFVEVDSEIIYVSTIHKVKGKEFDNVFIMLKDFKPDTDESKRQFYVAITRARTNLFIHYNNDFLHSLNADNLFYTKDSREYDELRQTAMYLTHRDVNLGYFGFVQKRLTGLQSGSKLTIIEDGLGNSRGELILKYSQVFKESLLDKERNGFRLSAAKVNFIIYWKDENTEMEVKIVLPEILLIK